MHVLHVQSDFCVKRRRIDGCERRGGRKFSTVTVNKEVARRGGGHNRGNIHDARRALPGEGSVRCWSTSLKLAQVHLGGSLSHYTEVQGPNYPTRTNEAVVKRLPAHSRRLVHADSACRI